MAAEGKRLRERGRGAGGQEEGDDESKRASKRQRVGSATTRTAAKADGRAALAWLLAPLTVDEFYAKYWEKQPLVIRRSDDEAKRKDFASLMTSQTVKDLLDSNRLTYAQDIDVTRYKDGQRESKLGDGAAKGATVWPQFKDQGYSVRMLCPHAHVDALCTFMSRLENHFQCFVGSNTYLTPQGSQGFPPHCDDIEAFLLQVEGSKHWRVYEPLTQHGVLAREAKQFPDASLGRPVVDTVLHPGDVLYFPRGWIHQGVVAADVPHSFHITLSTALHQNWGDLVRHTMQHAVSRALRDMEPVRRSVPRHAAKALGVMRSDVDGEDGEGGAGHDGGSVSGMREALWREAASLAYSVAVEGLSASVEAASDAMARNFVHGRLPPVGATRRSLQRSMVASLTILDIWTGQLQRDATWCCPADARVTALWPHLVAVSKATKGTAFVVTAAWDNARVHKDAPESKVEVQDTPFTAALIKPLLVDESTASVPLKPLLAGLPAPDVRRKLAQLRTLVSWCGVALSTTSTA